MKKANPQGKGVVPLLNSWDKLQSGLTISHKNERELLQDYVTSFLVISAQIRFVPVPGKDYYLYLQNGEWRLSLIAPEQWGDKADTHFAGVCRLRADACWDFSANPDLAQCAELTDALEVFQDNLLNHVDSDKPFSQLLPFYEAGLPYYARMLATAFSKSMGLSINRLGLPGYSGRELLGATPLPTLDPPTPAER